MTVQQKFKEWMLSIEHPVLGWISEEWFEPGDDPTTYANDYIQGAWMVYASKVASEEKHLAERMKAAGMIPVDEIIKGMPIDAFLRHTGVNDLDSFTQWVEMKRREYVSMQARFELDNRQEDELYDWAVAHASAFGQVMVNFKAAMDEEKKRQYH